MPTQDFTISTGMAPSMKSPAGLIPGVSSTISMWSTHRQPPPNPWPALERCTESRSGSEENPPSCAVQPVKNGPDRCSTNCAPGSRKRSARFRPRARPRARSAAPLPLACADALGGRRTAGDRQQRDRAGVAGIALGRKNYLFMGSDSGGHRAASLYSLIGTARMSGLDPASYLRTVLATIAEHPINRIQELLPWKIAASLQTDSSQAA